jgi:hypothetical protein
MFDVRHADGAQRKLLQVRKLRKYERLLLASPDSPRPPLRFAHFVFLSDN